MANSHAKFFAILAKLGLDYETDVRDELQALYGVRSIRLLTLSEFHSYTARLQALADGKAPAAALPPHRERAPQVGYCTSFDQLRLRALAAVSERRVWPGEAHQPEVECLAYVLNRALQYRRRDGRLSLAQVEGIIGVCGRYPLWAFRRAVEIWGGTDKPTNENFFYGICRNVIRDHKLAQSQPLHGLSVV